MLGARYVLKFKYYAFRFMAGQFSKYNLIVGNGSLDVDPKSTLLSLRLLLYDPDQIPNDTSELQ